MADLRTSISHLTKTCRHELDELSSSHRDAVKRNGHDTLTKPPTALDLLAWVPEQKTKLNLFADVLGVFASGPLSVEHRLRNNSAVRSSIAQLLEAISKNLCLCIRLRVQLAGPQQTTDDDPIEPAPAYDVTKIACRRIGRDVANLVRFAALIRLRSMQQYRERSEHHEPLDHDGLPLGDYFDKVVTRALKETFEDTGMAELLDDSSQDIQQSVPHRIRQTVTSRWKRICYHIARYQQLRGSDSPAEENVDDEDIVMENVQFDADVKHAVPLRGDGIHASKNVVVPQHEKATTFQGSLNEQAKVPQPPSITPSVALTNVAGFSVRMPRLRKQDVTYENGMLEFLCPLCKIPQQLPSDRSAVHQHRAWEKHAFYDLEPYICLLECKTPEATYRTFEDWTRHINNEHACYTWQCQNCTESCDNQVAFEQHLRSQHEAKLTAGELAFIAKTCERPVAAFSACFFCGKYELSGQAEAETRDAAALRQRKMMRCMAQHMRSMALTSLPDQLSVSDGSAESAARVSDASQLLGPIGAVNQSDAKSTDPRRKEFDSILAQLNVQYKATHGRADFTNEWRLNSDLKRSDNRPADHAKLTRDPETHREVFAVVPTPDFVGEGPPRYDGMPLTFDNNEPLSAAITTRSSYWSVPEQTDFAKYIAHFGTDFAAIANHMGTKSQVMVKNHFQRQVDGGRAYLAEQAEQANQRRKRGEDMGPPPTPTPISKRKYDTLETSFSHGSPSQTLPMPLDADHPEAARERTQKSTDGRTGVLPAIEDNGYISDEIDPVRETIVSSWDRRLSDVPDEGFASLQTYPGPPQQKGQGEGPSRSMTLPGMDQDSPKLPASNKRHKCPYCATEFTRHHNLKSHLLTHSQEKPYVCQTRQARFRRLHDLKRHTKLHTGERPHTCDKCGRRFARDNALARHNKAPGGCAGGQSSLEDEDDDGGDTYNEDLPLGDARPFDVDDEIVFALNHGHQNPPPSPNSNPTAIFREPSENSQPSLGKLPESSSVEDPFEFFGAKKPRLNAEPPPATSSRPIHCRSLSIGTWKIVGRTVKDLSVYYWVDQAIVAYLFSANGMGCKIEYPFAWIKHIMADELFIELIRPPKFYRENTANFTGGFVECSDFTDNEQASQVMIHRLGGHAELVCQELKGMKSLNIYRQRHDSTGAAANRALPYPNANMMRRPVDKFETLEAREEDGLSQIESGHDQISCICGFADDDGWMVQCEKCKRWQHQSCYHQFDVLYLPEDLQHFCADCEPRNVDAHAAQRRQLAKRVSSEPLTKASSSSGTVPESTGLAKNAEHFSADVGATASYIVPQAQSILSERSGKYLGIRDFPGEGTFHLYEGGFRIPTHVDGEQVNVWGLTKANKPRKRRKNYFSAPTPISAVERQDETPQTSTPQTGSQRSITPRADLIDVDTQRTSLVLEIPKVAVRNRTVLQRTAVDHDDSVIDPAGKLKVSKDGRLRGGREYQCRTFTLPGRGPTLYMLATECARVLGYRDSDILFIENQTLDKMVIGQAEKDDLLDRNILPRFDRARQVAVVTARSIFRQFGSRVIEDGQPGRDDYWEADAQHQGHAGLDLPSSGSGDEFPSHSGIGDLVGNSPSKVHEAVPPVPLHTDSTSADTLRDSKRSLIPRKGQKRPATRCLACSEFGIRCDLGVGGCMQCEKAGIPCRMLSTNAEPSRDPNQLRNPPEAQESRVGSCLTCRERKIRCDPGDNGCLQCAERGTPCRMLNRQGVKRSGLTFRYLMPLEQHETTQAKAPETARSEDTMNVDTDDEGGQALHQARVHDQLGVPFNTVPF